MEALCHIQYILICIWLLFLNVNQADAFFLFFFQIPLFFKEIWGLESMHNIYNVPSEPERAAEARRAVVASVIAKPQWHCTVSVWPFPNVYYCQHLLKWP